MGAFLTKLCGREASGVSAIAAAGIWLTTTEFDEVSFLLLITHTPSLGGDLMNMDYGICAYLIYLGIVRASDFDSARKIDPLEILGYIRASNGSRFVPFSRLFRVSGSFLGFLYSPVSQFCFGFLFRSRGQFPVGNGII